MAVENVALKAPEERARLTDLAVSHGRLDVLGWRAEARVAGRALFRRLTGAGRRARLTERDRGWPSAASRGRPHSFSSGIAREGQTCS